MARALLVRSKDSTGSPEFVDLGLDQFPEEPVTVRISHSSMNYKDALALTGRSPVIRRFPMVPGIDLAGVVEEDRSGMYRPGDQVVVNGYGLGEVHWGGYAEVARLKPEWLVSSPQGLSAADCMAIGTAGLRAALCVQALESHGVSPDRGPVAVTGATGGVGSQAVVLLAKAGYQVVAVTGRPSEMDYLRDLGAAEILDRAELTGEPKPLAKERWAAAVDVVGGPILANLLSSIHYGGAVAACGLAQSMSLPTTVAPFILRGVSLLGVDSVMASHERRMRAWERIGRDFDRDLLTSMTARHPLEEAVALAPRLLDGQLRGRIVLEVGT